MHSQPPDTGRGRKRSISTANVDDPAQYGAKSQPDSLGATQRPLAALKPRAYQLEMLDESLKQNIIVALVWFLAPKVPLAEQQHQAISTQIPAYQTRILTGSDNVDRWSTQKIWDGVLENIRIVVSTPQVLLDALSNGFLSLRRIALLVFDEAHHCVKSSAENRIMQHFYHAQKAQLRQTDDLPYILGLTASPTSSVAEDALRQLETNLDARCKTPKTNREEMMQFVHIPEMRKITYAKPSVMLLTMESKLTSLLNDIDITRDPFYQMYKDKQDYKSQERFQQALIRKTPCLTQLKQCVTRTIHIFGELGRWAASAYLTEIYQRNRAKEQRHIDQSWSEWDKKDSSFINNELQVFVKIFGETSWDTLPFATSQKLDPLIDLLSSEFQEGSRGIVFVEQRAVAVMLAHFISLHPKLAHINSDYLLGTSSFASRKVGIAEISNPNNMKDSLENLKTGKKNLLIATSVAEEGIDVSACDLVICFEPPKQLRSFIQRRGRARKKGAKYLIFYDEEDTAAHKNWTTMEEIMKDKYSNDNALFEEVPEPEDGESDYETMRIQSTGALLTLDNAPGHLSHFCATLHCEFTTNQPEFVFKKTIDSYQIARVLLPTVLDPKFREYGGIQKWKTQKNAKRDAAFQAYLHLYKAKLVNDHLMPEHCQKTIEEHEQIEKRPSMTTCPEVFNPWIKVAAQWQMADTFYQNRILIGSQTIQLPQMLLVLPLPLPCNFEFRLYWNEANTLTASISPEPLSLSESDMASAPLATHVLLSSVYSSRMSGDSRDFSCIFAPNLGTGNEGLEEWCTNASNRILGGDNSMCNFGSLENFGLARSTDVHSRPWTVENLVWMKSFRKLEIGDEEKENNEEEEDILHVEGEMWPKRTDFLHPVANEAKLHTGRKCYPLHVSSISMLPIGFTRFALFIPSLIHNIGRYLLAEELSKTILAPVGFTNIELVLTSITATSARENTNYQRYEFLGDSTLKLHTCMQLLADHPFWHEGLLTQKKGLLVSNSRLSRAARKIGLDRFILTVAFTGAKWRPLYNSIITNNVSKEPSTRNISTKTLADVIEALIGAAIIDGGDDKALRCLRVFIPDINWLSFKECITLMYDAVPGSQDGFAHETTMSKIESLLGYSFTKKALLAASLSHPSNPTGGMTYQRLEFLGDSILDTVVTNALFRSDKTLPHQDMHLIRTALVNADFLAFLCLGISTDERRGEVSVSSDGKIETSSSTRKIAIWQYMTHAITFDIADAQQATVKEFEQLRDEIEEALQSGMRYPWTLLSTLNAPKFFSDIIESILGAIFIDSHGSMERCTAFLDSIGLMKYLNRALEDENIDFMHPKQRLGIVSQSLPVDYPASSSHVEHVGIRWECKVIVGEKEVARVENGVSRVQVETKAADAALEILRVRSYDDI